MGTALLGLVGCESQPYKPWQSTDSWWDKDDHADKQAEMTKAAEQATAEKQVPAYTPVKAEEPAQMRVSPPVTDAEPYEAPASMVTMEPEPSRASGAGTPARTTGDVLLIDSIQSTPDIRTPRNGMSMRVCGANSAIHYPRAAALATRPSLAGNTKDSPCISSMTWSCTRSPTARTGTDFRFRFHTLPALSAGTRTPAT